MSNSHYRREEAPAQSTLDQRLLYQKLAQKAVDQLYLKLGGEEIEMKIAYFKLGMRNAMTCREAEAGIMGDGSGGKWLAPDRRPMVTMSEGRLYARELDRFMERRAEKRAEARTRIEEALNRESPVNEQEFKKVLDAAVNDVDDLGRLLDLQRHREESTPAVRREITELMALMPPRDREEMGRAWQHQDLNLVRSVASRQPKEQQERWQRLLPPAA